MPAVTRLGDNCTGHGCFPARPSTGASPDVYANGIAVHRQSDGWASHCCPPVALRRTSTGALRLTSAGAVRRYRPAPTPSPDCHGGALAAGSSTVFANGLQLGRIGDPVDCGSSVAEGSADVFAGP